MKLIVQLPAKILHEQKDIIYQNCKAINQNNLILIFVYYPINQALRFYNTFFNLIFLLFKTN